MKGYARFFLIAVMSLGLVFLLLTRAREPWNAPTEDLVVGVDAGDAGSDGAALAADAAGSVDAAPAKPTERPLRIAALGWELVAPGAALTAPDGGPTGPYLEMAPESSLDSVKERLARGGSDAVGADIAILPLPAFVVAYDSLRVLDPRAFAVIGFSHGREEMHAAAGALLKAPPAADEVKLVALGPATSADASARASGSESATLLGLFGLDLLGVPSARVRVVGPGAADAKTAPFSAILRGAADDRKLAFSTSDASRLVPIVAIASKKQLDENEPKMRAFVLAWLDGLQRAGKDASNVARRLANKEALPLGAGVGGAPEAIALLDRLGQIEPATLAQQGLYIGPGARGAVTLETLTQRTWSLARAGGLTTSTTPVPLPIDARVVTAIAPPPAPAPAPSDADGGSADAGAFAALPTGGVPLVIYRVPSGEVDAAGVATQLGFLSGVFERAAFRISAKGGEKAARSIAAQARERFSIPTTRLATAGGEPAGGAFATVEIIALP